MHEPRDQGLRCRWQGPAPSLRRGLGVEARVRDLYPVLQDTTRETSLAYYAVRVPTAYRLDAEGTVAAAARGVGRSRTGRGTGPGRGFGRGLPIVSIGACPLGGTRDADGGPLCRLDGPRFQRVPTAIPDASQHRRDRPGGDGGTGRARLEPRRRSLVPGSGSGLHGDPSRAHRQHPGGFRRRAAGGGGLAATAVEDGQGEPGAIIGRCSDRGR